MWYLRTGIPILQDLDNWYRPVNHVYTEEDWKVIYYPALCNPGSHRTEADLLGMSPCALPSSLHNWLVNSPDGTSHCVKVAATQLKRQGCCDHLTHWDSSPDVHKSWRAVRAARLPWQGPGWVAEFATISLTAVVHTLSQLWKVLEDLKKSRKWSKCGDKHSCSNWIEKVAIAFININMNM